MTRPFRIVAAATILGALLAPLAALSASAAPVPVTRTVGAGQAYSSIQAAVDASSNGDTVDVLAGTYTENVVVLKYLTITGAGADTTTVRGDASLSNSVFTVQTLAPNPDFGVSISGFTITGGNTPAGGAGGGMTINNASPEIHDNVITENHTDGYGGGIVVTAGSRPVIYNNTISDNTATMGGGGIHAIYRSVPVIVNNTITGNSTSGFIIADDVKNIGGSSGGGIYMEAQPGDNGIVVAPIVLGNTINNNSASFAGGGVMMRTGIAAILEDNEINGNTAAYGGGVHIETGGAGPNLWGNTITGNVAMASGTFAGSGAGGGVAIYDHSTATLTGNTISNNWASKYGGGISSAEGANSVITGNTISTNSTNTVISDADGGGIYVANSAVQITNNVIDNNTGDKGGGIGVLDGATAMIVNNTIVENNEQDQAGGAVFITPSGTTTTVANNIIAANQGFQIFEPVANGSQPKAVIDSNLFGAADSPSDGLNGTTLGVYFSYIAHGGVGDIATVSSLDSDATIDAENNLDGPIDFTDASKGDFSITATSAAVDAATASTAAAVAIDIRGVVRTTADIGAYESAPGAVPVTAPTLFGDAEVSKAISVTTGAGGPISGSYSYEWFVDGTLVAGETASTYEPRPADVGHTVSATVTVTKYGVYSTTQTTSTSAGVLPAGQFARNPRAGVLERWPLDG